MRGTPRLMAKILYGSGLRLMECMRLRVKDIDIENHQIIYFVHYLLKTCLPRNSNVVNSVDSYREIIFK